MSGGSFNYVCYKLNGGDGYEVPQALHDLRSMEEYLRDVGKHEIADELLRGIVRIETAAHRLAVVGEHLFELAHAVEWWVSADYGEDQVDAIFKEKYLGESEATDD